MIERRPHVAHSLGARGVVHVGVHVPHEIRRHRHEPAARFAQTPGEQQQLAERFGVVDVVRIVVPLAIDLVRPHERGRVVPLDHARIFRAPDRTPGPRRGARW